MSLLGLAALAVLAILATVVAGRRAPRARWRRVLAAPTRALPDSATGDSAAGDSAAGDSATGDSAASTSRSGSGWAGLRRSNPLRLQRLASAPSKLGVCAVAVTAAGAIAAGPVAGVVLAAYCGTGVVVLLRRRARRRREASRTRAVDAVAALAAQLRAGVSVTAAMAGAAGALDPVAIVGAPAATVARRVASAVEVAEASGAPLADVLDRLDLHLRAIDRARANASAQAAGASASAGLLALMPVAGAAMGYLVGVDSLHVLLHTPLGSACLLAAVALQLGGLAWAARLSQIEVTA